MADIFIPDLEATERMHLLEYVFQAVGTHPRVGRHFSASAREVYDSVGGAEILGVALGRVDASVFEAASRLRLVVKCGIGTDNIDLVAARSAGVRVVRTAGVNFRGVAEFVIGATIAHLRRFSALDQAVRTGKWDSIRAELAGRLDSLVGRTLGLVGFGVIGSEVARLAQAHGMSVMVYDPWVDRDRLQSAGVAPARLDQVLASADVVSLHVVLNDSTRHIIDERELALMRPTALLVNTSRGPVVNEAVLIEALEEGRIAGAVLDVFESEPVPRDSRLLSVANCLLSPHVAGCTATGYREIGQLAAELMRAFLTGEELPAQCVVV